MLQFSMIHAPRRPKRMNLKNSLHYLCEPWKRPLEETALEVDFEGWFNFGWLYAEGTRPSEEAEVR